MHRHDCGLWIPDVMVGPSAFLKRADAIGKIMSLPGVRDDRVFQRRSCIQAGGHIGVYPQRLAGYFDAVYTFEPERENFACLAANVADRENVFCYRAFLGDEHGRRFLQRHYKSSGGHHTGEPGGIIPTFRVDDLELSDVDAIFLDLEGYELPALCGAIRTIRISSPLLVIEENKQMRYHGRSPGDIEALLAPLGYRCILRLDEDIVLAVSASK